MMIQRWRYAPALPLFIGPTDWNSMNRQLAVVILVCINILWGSSYGITKIVFAEVPPLLFGATRWILGAACLWLIQLWLWWRQAPNSPLLAANVAPADRRRLFGLGILSMGFAYMLAYPGINLTTATDAALMISAEVFFTSLLAAWLAHEALGKWKLWGMVLGATGVTILVLGHLTGDNSNSNGWARALGDILILINLAMQALYTVFGTGLARKYPPITMLTYVCTGSLVVWVPVMLWYLFTGSLPATLSLTAIGGILYLTLITSLFCNLIWFTVARHIGAGLAAISLFAQPLVGAFIGLVFFNEPLTISLIIGALLVFVALYLITIVPLAAQGESRVTNLVES